MKVNGGFLVTKIKQLGDRIFEKILSEKNIDAFNGAQGRILYVLWQEDGIPIRLLSVKCGLAICTPHCTADDDVHVLNLIFDTNTHDSCHPSRFFLIRSRHSSNRVISSSEKPL